MSSRQAFPLAPRWYPLRVASLLATALLATLIVLRSNHQYVLRRDFSQCEANLHQLGAAMLLYAQDYDQTLPGMWTGADGNGRAGGWLAYLAWPNASPRDLQPERGVLAPYLQDLTAFTCPSDRSRRGCSYAMNALLTVDGARNGGFHPGRRLADVVTPDHTLMLVEACSPPLAGPADGCAQPNCIVAWSRHRYGSDGDDLTNVVYVGGNASPLGRKGVERGREIYPWNFNLSWP